MNTQEIARLIEIKEAQDKIWQDKKEKAALRTREVFSVIKDDVIDACIKEAISSDYRLSNMNITSIVASKLAKHEYISAEFALDYELGNLGCIYFDNKDVNKEDCEFVINEIDSILLTRNIKNQLAQLGFDEGRYDLTTSKESLLAMKHNGKNDNTAPNINNFDESPCYKWIFLVIALVLFALWGIFSC